MQAVVGLRFDCSAPISSHTVEVLCFGTAVCIKVNGSADKPGNAKGKDQNQQGGKKGKQKGSVGRCRLALTVQRHQEGRLGQRRQRRGRR